MTPAERTHKLIDDLNKAIDTQTRLIFKAFSDARLEALEEAAKIVVEAGREFGQRTADINDLAAAIRERAKE